MFANHEPCHCERCGHRAPAVRAPLSAKIGLVALYLAAVAMMVGAALTGFGAVFVAPMALAICASIQAPLAEAATAPPRCARCRAVVSEPDVRADSVAAPRALPA
jgi:hypothetical protein